MAKKDEKNLNITIKNQEGNKEMMIISLSSILSHLKKYFVIWLVFAIIAGVVATAFSGFKTLVAKPSITALVSFTYKGVEKGLDPAGRTFDVNSIKSPTVIEGALSSLDIDIENLDNIRKNISIDGIIPEDAVNRITAYKNIYETATSGNLAAAQAMQTIGIPLQQMNTE